jgi:cell division protein FtsN
MRKFEKKINELNLEKGKLSKTLNQNIKDFEVLEQSLVGLRAELRHAEADGNDEEIDRLTQEVEELEGELMNFDEVLVDKVQNYADNYDSYQLRLKKMEEGRKAKAAAKTAPTSEPTPAPAATPKPSPEPTAAPVNDPTPTPKVEEVEEKKGTNWLLWGVLGVAGIFVGINLFKNKR